eukprot:scaffold377_cov563-Prasinococcus_capsulatus_cf.AAC.23
MKGARQKARIRPLAFMSVLRPKTLAQKLRKFSSHFSLLLGRAKRQTMRDLYVHLVRAAGSLILAATVSSMFKSIKNDRTSKGIKGRAGLILHTCINTSFMAMVKTLNSMPKESAVVSAEMMRSDQEGEGCYRVEPYFLSKLCVETPVDAVSPLLFGLIVADSTGLNPKRRPIFLGTIALQALAASTLGMSVSALAPTADAALAIGPVLMVLSIMTADSGGLMGMQVPEGLKALSNASLLKWAFEGCLASELRGLELEPEEGLEHAEESPNLTWLDRLTGKDKIIEKIREETVKAVGKPIRTGDEVMESLGLGGQSSKSAAGSQLKLIGVNLTLTYALLKLKGSSSGFSPQPFDASLPLDCSTYAVPNRVAVRGGYLSRLGICVPSSADMIMSKTRTLALPSNKPAALPKPRGQ